MFERWFRWERRARARAPEVKSGAPLIALQLGASARWTPRDMRRSPAKA